MSYNSLYMSFFLGEPEKTDQEKQRQTHLCLPESQYDLREAKYSKQRETRVEQN